MRKELGQLLGQRGKLGADRHYHWPVHSYYVILRAVDLLGEHVLKLCYWHGTTAVGRVLKNERHSLYTTPLFRQLLPRAAEGPPLEEQRKSTQKAISMLGQGTNWETLSYWERLSYLAGCGQKHQGCSPQGATGR